MQIVIDRDKEISKLKEMLENLTDEKDIQSVKFAINILEDIGTPLPKRYCRDCRWWKDSDGTYRRGVGAESQCPINCKEVYDGNGYCFFYAPQVKEINADGNSD